MTAKKNLSIIAITLGSGGAERVISRLLEPLTKDFNVSLVLFYDIIHYDIPPGINKVILFSGKKPSISAFGKIKDLLGILKRYNSFIKSNDINVSMSFLTLPNIVNGIIAMRRKKLKTIISERCYPSLMYKYNRFSMLFAKIAFPLFYNRSTKLFSNSVHINEDLRSNFRIKIPMSVIYNPIEVGPEKKDTTLINEVDCMKVINVGTLYGPKNQQLILEAFKRLNRGEFHLTVLGEGPFKEDLDSYIEKNGLQEDTDFKGKVNNVKEHLLENDCFVLSSNNEGFPNVLLEAMSVGLPPISTNCMSGPLELLNDNEPIIIPKGGFYKAKYGVLINVKDDFGLAEALKYYKNNPEERKKYSKLSIERAKDFELSNIYKQVKELIIS